ncbi:hypothetical protein AVEN_266299-1 [Araneus ventricosus]|uniref:Uncharacterized protein n=1 Tax=Araneus ventricosus TaxID=182803 RepID=A0A4Y2EDK7_ARAVE|nr:hypothetical protein AVEN_266299-1 [Araneus ventricosus]
MQELPSFPFIRPAIHDHSTLRKWSGGLPPIWWTLFHFLADSFSKDIDGRACFTPILSVNALLEYTVLSTSVSTLSLFLNIHFHRPASTQFQWCVVMDIGKRWLSKLPLHTTPKLTSFHIHAQFWLGVDGFSWCRVLVNGRL